jgi:hypothetical protein
MRQDGGNRKRIGAVVMSLLWLATTVALVQLYFFLSH